MSEAGPGRHIPEFAVTLRGYDRGQVEEYVLALQAFLAEAQRRAAAAEAELAELPDGGSPAALRDETSRPDQTNRADEGALGGDAAAHVDPSDPLLEGLPDRVGASVARILAEAQQAARVLLDEAQTQPSPTGGCCLEPATAADRRGRAGLGWCGSPSMRPTARVHARKGQHDRNSTPLAWSRATQASP